MKFKCPVCKDEYPWPFIYVPLYNLLLCRKCLFDMYIVQEIIEKLEILKEMEGLNRKDDETVTEDIRKESSHRNPAPVQSREPEIRWLTV